MNNMKTSLMMLEIKKMRIRKVVLMSLLHYAATTPAV